MYKDPSVILLKRDSIFKRLESDLILAQSNAEIEFHLYPLLNRVVTDFCNVNEGDNRFTLECHPQAYFGDSAPGSYRLPDCAACTFDSRASTMKEAIKPIFWFEAKPLPDSRNWRKKEVLIDTMTSSYFAAAIPQVREQVKHAFRSFDGPTQYPVFILVGLYWSMLIFDKDKEQRAYEHEETVASQVLARQAVAANLLALKDRATSTASTTSVVDPGGAQEKSRFSSPERQIDVFDDYLPELKYFNEPLLLGTPVQEYNPAFLHALSTIMEKHEFSQQPSCFDVPHNYQYVPTINILANGMKRLRTVYRNILNSIMVNASMEREDEEYSQSEDSKDGSYKPPGRYNAPPHWVDNEESPIQTRARTKRDRRVISPLDSSPVEQQAPRGSGSGM
ncbi:hypothetical protein C8R41DRAFT_866858 [Lentinula lateritia]|uniref:HNH nuclease domain-containing protein n=1 Tax=Lentinula lateritia TaxID=40482 RepID=A0ABQ8VGS4_9AGAR|nr:hypothetical protein C8R41DRAFT_866858 [Lentinula lateritia]